MTDTPIKGASFWDGTHPLSALQEDLSERLVPGKGEAQTPHGELLRCATNLYCDAYNNGFCNREALREQLAFVESKKSELLPFLQNPESWRSSLGTLLKKAGDDAGDEEPCAEADKLEDIITAVVKYVAQKEGLALPTA